MIWRNVVIATLLFCMILTVTSIGCGDADEPSAENLVGTWETVHNSGTSDAESPWTEIVFAADSSVLWYVKVEWEEEGIAFKFDLAVSGTYAVSGSTLTLVSDDVETTFAFDFPVASSDVAREALNRFAENLAAQTSAEVARDAASDIWKGTWRLEEDLLTLTGADGTETVFMRK